MRKELGKRTERAVWVLLACLVLALMLVLPTAGLDLTALCNAGIALLCALVTYRLVPWIRARASKEQQEALALAARTAVYAAEQLYRTGTIRDRLEYAEKWLESHGYTVDRAQIEAQVKQMRIDSVMETITTADEEEKDDE